MKNTLVFIFILGAYVHAYSQSFGEIIKVKPIGDKIFPIGPTPLIKTSFDVNKSYNFKFNELVPTIGRESFWESKNLFTLDLSEVAFVNWNAGGTNSISGLFGMNLIRTYKNRGFRWENQLRVKYGINQQEGQELRKTDDDLELISSFGYEVSKKSKWFYSGKFSLKTQSARGYNYPDIQSSISEFMAPGYLFLGVGAKYVEKDQKFQMYLSPLTSKSTFVLNQRLANKGAFGVDAAIRDEDGNIIKEGRTSRNELGILVTSELEEELFDSTVLVSRLHLYTDYLNNFGNIDVDWELALNFKINNFLRANLGAHLRYDDDIKIREQDSNGEDVELGARIQLKQQLGIGIVVDL